MNKIEWSDKGWPVAVAGKQNAKGAWLLEVLGCDIPLRKVYPGDPGTMRRVVRNKLGAYCVTHANALWPLCKADCDEVDALKEIFGDWVDPTKVRAMRGEVVTRSKRIDTMPLPDVLTGLDGEVQDVTQWLMTDGQLSHLAGSPNDGLLTDCLIHFDRIKLGGHNSRRVRMHDGVVYVVAKGRNLPIGGALLERVRATVTRVFDSKAWTNQLVARVQEEQAALAAERYNEENVHGDETKC